MTTPQEQLDYINDNFALVNERKFMKGQAEHGGNFFAKPALPELQNEIIDLVNYATVLVHHKYQLMSDLEELHTMLVLVSELPKDIPIQWSTILDMVVEIKSRTFNL